MLGFLGVLVFVTFCKCSADGYPDLIPEAVTVYRNPDFFKNLNYGTKIDYSQKSTKVPEAEARESYKYPGETKKPNPSISPGFEVNYDNSPEFHHEPRDIFVDIAYKPGKRKGPYNSKHYDEDSFMPASDSNVRKPSQAKESEEGESKESKENVENENAEEPREFASLFNENPEKDFAAYYKPILLARPNFDPEQSSGFASSTYNQPYPYNRSSPILYEDWKFYAYPKIHAQEHLKSNPRIYSEEPPSNSFEDDSLSYYRYDDENEDASNFFDSNEFKNSGADTKHIYKKLLKPKKSLVFKLHSKPKFKKLKFKLKKKHLHNTDWFDEYPFNF